MASPDPTTRREAARTAARTRVARMDDEARRDMTAAARRALRQADLERVDDEARRLGQYPLDDSVRNFRADLLAAVRAKKASDAAANARRLRAGDVENLLAHGAILRAGLAEEAAGA